MKIVRVSLSIAIALIVMVQFGYAQTFIFGPKLGPSLSFQQWNGVQREALLTGHAAAFIETYNEGDPSSLFASFGYHQRGTAERGFATNVFANETYRRTLKYKFHNLSLMLGAKRILNLEAKAKPFYTIGVRAEYTLKTNLDRFDDSPYVLYFPNNFFVNKFNYGVSAGGGFQYQLSELVGGTVELTISPDVSKQYEQQQIPDVIDPRGGNTRTLQEQNVRNMTVEVSFSLRFLRKVIYYD